MHLRIGLVLVLLVLLAAPGAVAAGPDVVIYSGRSKSLVAPLIEQLQRETGLKVEVRYGKTAALALILQEEGARTPADLYWAQDAGALATLSRRGFLARLPEALLARVPAELRGAQGTWVGTSGRARVLAYSTRRIKPEELPKSVFDLTAPKWKGRVGWAPMNASFQAFVTAMRIHHGDEKTLAWLKAMKENGAKAYPKNTPILQALAAGEIDLGLPNHYYLLRFKAADKNFPVAQTTFAKGDIGNLLNVAGAGILKSSKRKEAGQRCLAFLLSPKAQQYFTSSVFEYPVIEGVIPNPSLLPLQQLREQAAPVDLGKLDGLPATLKMLREAGLL